MPITSLRITNFRNLAAVELAMHAKGLNIICGNNGSGKTSLLEAIYYLGAGKSFRAAVAKQLIRHQTDKFSIFSQLITETERLFPIGIEREKQGRLRIRMDNQELTGIMELASSLPIRLIHAQSHTLFESGPVFRRKYLDWGLFYLFNENFLGNWRHFGRSLRQRNSILRNKRSLNELKTWTAEVLKYGSILDQLRREYIEQLTPVMCEVTHLLLNSTNIKIDYQPGWDSNQDFATVLNGDEQEAYHLGYTPYGPHRADFDITMDAISVKHFLSRGQQKLLICAMMVAQGMILEKCANKSLIYLIDDLPSELDEHSRRKLISLLSRQNAQVFITSIDSKTISECMSHYPGVLTKVFHVEQGEIKEVISESNLAGSHGCITT